MQWTANPDIGTFSDDDALTTDWTAPAAGTSERPAGSAHHDGHRAGREPDRERQPSRSPYAPTRGRRSASPRTRPPWTSATRSTLTGSCHRPGGADASAYSWTSDGGGTFGTPTALNTTWVAPNVGESIPITLTLRATDPLGRSGTAAATVIVRAATVHAPCPAGRRQPVHGHGHAGEPHPAGSNGRRHALRVQRDGAAGGPAVPQPAHRGHPCAAGHAHDLLRRDRLQPGHGDAHLRLDHHRPAPCLSRRASTFA